MQTIGGEASAGERMNTDSDVQSIELPSGIREHIECGDDRNDVDFIHGRYADENGIPVRYNKAFEWQPTPADDDITAYEWLERRQTSSSIAYNDASDIMDSNSNFAQQFAPSDKGIVHIEPAQVDLDAYAARLSPMKSSLPQTTLPYEMGGLPGAAAPYGVAAMGGVLPRTYLPMQM